MSGRVDRATKWLPGLVGAALVVAGATVIWAPAGLIVAGAFLLLFDERRGQ